jgi:hypothetical protein
VEHLELPQEHLMLRQDQVTLPQDKVFLLKISSPKRLYERSKTREYPVMVTTAPRLKTFPGLNIGEERVILFDWPHTACGALKVCMSPKRVTTFLAF